jgi:hypothetical protein
MQINALLSSKFSYRTINLYLEIARRGKKHIEWIKITIPNNSNVIFTKVLWYRKKQISITHFSQRKVPFKLSNQQLKKKFNSIFSQNPRNPPTHLNCFKLASNFPQIINSIILVNLIKYDRNLPISFSFYNLKLTNRKKKWKKMGIKPL